jgi:methyltransferase (TIGR00027 family)
MTTGNVSGVSRTAIGVAWLRAKEHARLDRLFEDPYAGAFVRRARDTLARETGSSRGGALGELFGLHVVLRTRFYDDYLLAAAEAGCRQVVILAAGLDARAFRLAWPAHTRLFELDLPDLLEFKEQVLAGHTPRAERTVIPVDLREDWPAALTGAGFRRDEPTAWLIEGLLVYLSPDEASALLTAVGDLSAPGSRLACEHRGKGSEQLLAKVAATPEMHGVLAMWKGGLGTELAGWLTGAGWRVRTHDGEALAARYGRDDPGASTISFLTAVREGQETHGQ